MSTTNVNIIFGKTSRICDGSNFLVDPFQSNPIACSAKKIVFSFSIPKNNGRKWVNFSFESDVLTPHFMYAWILRRSKVVDTDLISPVLGNLEIVTPAPSDVSFLLNLNLVWNQTTSSSRSSESFISRRKLFESFSLVLNGGHGERGPL